jgi:Zn finger protein HypA/HybF involved in hydrogenase expression
MHGIHIAADIVKEAKKHGRVKKAVIEVGKIANITKEDLEKHLKSVADFEFKMTSKKAKVKCVCGYEGKPKIIERQHDIVIFSCPACSMVPEVIEGDKITLKSIEV